MKLITILSARFEEDNVLVFIKIAEIQIKSNIKSYMIIYVYFLKAKVT